MGTDEESAMEEAVSLLYHLSRGNYQFEYPIMMDFEHSTQTSLPADTQQLIIKKYCDIIRDAGMAYEDTERCGGQTFQLLKIRKSISGNTGNSFK